MDDIEEVDVMEAEAAGDATLSRLGAFVSEEAPPQHAADPALQIDEIPSRRDPRQPCCCGRWRACFVRLSTASKTR